MKRIDYLRKNIKPGNILDIGNLMWGGSLHKTLMGMFPGSTFYGLDIVDQKTVGLDFANQHIGSCTSLPFLDGLFDTIFAGQVIEHIWDPKAMADECYRTLKPGGAVIIDTPNIYSLSRMIRYMVKGKDVILGNPEHKIFFSFAMMENLLQQAGFKEIRLSTMNVLAFKSRLFTMPDCKPFTYLGECIYAYAVK